MPDLQRLYRIFVVDDEDIIASTLAMILRFRGGFHATSFNNPLEALRAARLDCPDVLITDVVMPHISGIDLAIQIRQSCPHCKILLFSGHAATGPLLESSRAMGHEFDIVVKPVHPAMLLAKIQDLVEEGRTMPPLDALALSS